MTITAPVAPTTTAEPYRDIHKGIRAVLFSVTSEAGRTDPSDRDAKAAFAANVNAAGYLLEEHAANEDTFIEPVLAEHAPGLAREIASAHVSINARVKALSAAAEAVVDAGPGEARAALHRLYLDLAGFTATYLEHQEMEERVVAPTLIAAIGNEELHRIDAAIVASIPPEVMAAGLAVMLPAMNIDDRAEMLGGMRMGAPAEVFAGVWALSQSVLDEHDARALADRLGL